MDISYFREFVILAETKNYWAASERLFIGQSSLSKHIKTMEKQLGAPLFARTSRKVELTDFGAQMLPYAQSIAKLQYEYEAAAYGILNEKSEKLSIASIPALSAYNIVDVLVRFQRDFPMIQVSTNEADTLIVRELLLEKKCDIGIFRGSVAYLEHTPEKENRLVKIPFCTDRLVAVLPKGHPLEKLESIELAQLKEESFALIRKDTMPYTLCMRACQEAGFTPKVLFTSHNLSAIFDMVTKGSCIALLFEQEAVYPLDSGLSIVPPFSVIPIAPEIQTPIYVAYLKDTALSRTARQFVEYCMMRQSNASIPNLQGSAEE